MKKTSILLIAFLVTFSSNSLAQQKAGFSASEKSIKPFYYICYEHVGPYSELPAIERKFLNDFFSTGITNTGQRIAVFWSSPQFVKSEDLRYDIGFVTDASQKSIGKMYVKYFNYSKVVSAIHQGPYETTYITTDALYRWIARNNYKVLGGPCVELYLDPNPDTVPDDKRMTEIFVPVE